VNNEVRRKLYGHLSKYVQSIGITILAFFGYMVKLKFENNVNNLDLYIIIALISVVCLFALGSALLFVGSSAIKKK
jgi:hypothetical protein